MFSRSPRIPLDITHPLPNEDQVSSPNGQAAAAFAAKLVKTTRIAFEEVKKAWGKDLDRRSKSYTDNGKNQYKVGDRVWLFTPTKQTKISPKLVSAWRGPYWIHKKISNILYEVRNQEGNENSKIIVVSIARMHLT